MNKQKKRKRYILPLLLLVVCFLLPVFNFNVTNADNSTYSNVLEDLQKDENFNVEDYPEIENNYSLKLIQIAESEDQELFIYVYQPSGQKQDLRATYLNLSLSNDASLSSLYTLKYLNSENTLFKYKVENVKFKSEKIRYYNLTSIYRDFLEGIDEELDFDNEINAVSFKVAKLWTVGKFNGQLMYDCVDTEIIDISDKYVGFIRYEANYLGSGYDNHFVAFDTDKKIENLKSARVCYSEQKVKEDTFSKPEFGEIEKNKDVDLDATNKHSVTATGGWFSRWEYEWEEIQTVKNFISNVDTKNVYSFLMFDTTVTTSITSESLKQLKDKQWVLRFATTKYDKKNYQSGMLIHTVEDYSLVGNVTILELTFETDGKVYNLGVVDNMQSGSGGSDSETNKKTELNWKRLLLMILGLIFGVLGLILMISFFPIIFPIVVWVFKFIIKIVWYILKGIWWVITLPIEIFKR